MGIAIEERSVVVVYKSYNEGGMVLRRKTIQKRRSYVIRANDSFSEETETYESNSGLRKWRKRAAKDNLRDGSEMKEAQSVLDFERGSWTKSIYY